MWNRPQGSGFLVTALIVVAAALAGATPAAADDQSVDRVFRADDGRFRSLRQDLDRAHAGWVRREARRPGPVLRVLARLRRLELSRHRRLSAEEGSSSLGREARRRLLRSLKLYVAATESTGRYVRFSTKGAELFRRGDEAGSRPAFEAGARGLRRAKRQEQAWKREDRAGRRLLREALERADTSSATFRRR